MGLDERRERWASMAARLAETDVNLWWQRFVAVLRSPAEAQASPA
jgi:trehalose-6-phosphate synthase